LDDPRPGLSFNLSHSIQTCVLAVSAGGEVGIDTEPRGPVADRDLLVQHVFTAEERDAFNAVPLDKRDDFFMRCWTRKEAMMKAVGVGLLYELSMWPAQPQAADGSVVAWTTPSGGQKGMRVFDLSDQCDIVALALLDTSSVVSIRERSCSA